MEERKGKVEREGERREEGGGGGRMARERDVHTAFSDVFHQRMLIWKLEKCHPKRYIYT